MELKLVLLLFIVCLISPAFLKKTKSTPPTDVDDHKEFKKLLRTKTNVLVAFMGKRSNPQLTSDLNQLSESVRGIGTVATVDCANSQNGKKLCKKLKVAPGEGHVLKHYHNGEFHLDYDRPENLKSMVSFMKDPTGDMPWDEVESAQDIEHVVGVTEFKKLLKREKGPVLAMFYAPWCGFCKRMKPDFEKAATELKGKGALLAIDTTKPENNQMSRQFNITGFPTLLYFENGKLQYPYPGDNKHRDIVEFMQNPTPEAPKKEQEIPWKDVPSDVHHLTEGTFDEFIGNEKHVLIMFYAPWCGHCKKMKPHFEAAAEKIKDLNLDGKLAAVDCTVERGLAERFEVGGYPTVIFFKDGQKAFDAGHARETEDIVKFMRDPKEPPPPPPPETPWQEEETEVIFLTKDDFKARLKKKKHALVMFYAPWCGHCKRAKPEFNGAAESFKDNPQVAFVGVDCTQEKELCTTYDVTGFPTFKYLRYFNKEPVRDYDGNRSKKDFIKFMKDPDNPGSTTPSPEDEWEGIAGAEYVVHLTDKNFSSKLKTVPKALVAFYAPWCGHCKAMKADYAAAALASKDDSKVMIAAVDATIQSSLARSHEIKGFPTIMFFSYGKYVKDYNGDRKKTSFLNFLSQQRASDEL